MIVDGFDSRINPIVFDIYAGWLLTWKAQAHLICGIFSLLIWKYPILFYLQKEALSNYPVHTLNCKGMTLTYFATLSYTTYYVLLQFALCQLCGCCWFYRFCFGLFYFYDQHSHLQQPIIINKKFSIIEQWYLSQCSPMMDRKEKRTTYSEGWVNRASASEDAEIDSKSGQSNDFKISIHSFPAWRSSLEGQCREQTD